MEVIHDSLYLVQKFDSSDRLSRHIWELQPYDSHISLGILLVQKPYVKTGDYFFIFIF
jgi:hypothetical protein